MVSDEVDLRRERRYASDDEYTVMIHQLAIW